MTHKDWKPLQGVAYKSTNFPGAFATYSWGWNRVTPFTVHIDVDVFYNFINQCLCVQGMLTTKRPIDFEAGQNLYTFTVLGESDGVLPGSSAVSYYFTINGMFCLNQKTTKRLTPFKFTKFLQC